MTVSHLRLIASSLGIVAIVGCAAGPDPAPSFQSGTSCEGQLYLVVHNNLEAPVDVYEHPGGAAGRRLVGTVGPGTQRLAVPQPLRSVYAERDGHRVSGRHAQRGARGTVTFDYVCVPA
jgi:hypothetical protein